MKINRIIAAALAFFALASFAGCKGDSKKSGGIISPKKLIQYRKSETDISESAADSDFEISDTVQSKNSDAEVQADAGSGKNAKTPSSKNSANPHYYLGLFRYEWQHWVVIKDKEYNSSNEYRRGSTYTYNSSGNIIKEEFFPFGLIVIEYEYNSDGTISAVYYKSDYPVKYFYKYNSQNQIVKIYESRNGITTPRTELEYDDNGRCVLIRSFCYDGSLRGELKYDSNGNLTEYTCGSSRYICKYDSKNLLTHMYMYNTDNGNELSRSLEIKYDKNGYVTYRKESNLIDGKTVINEKIITNDINGNPEQVKCYLTQDGKKALDYTSKTTYVYGDTVTATTRFTYSDKRDYDTAIQITEYEYHSHEAFNLDPDNPIST